MLNQLREAEEGLKKLHMKNTQLLKHPKLKL